MQLLEVRAMQNDATHISFLRNLKSVFRHIEQPRVLYDANLVIVLFGDCLELHSLLREVFCSGGRVDI